MPWQARAHKLENHQEADLVAILKDKSSGVIFFPEITGVYL